MTRLQESRSFINIPGSNHLAFDQHSLRYNKLLQLFADKKISKHEHQMVHIIFHLKTNFRKKDKRIEIKGLFFNACTFALFTSREVHKKQDFNLLEIAQHMF